MGAQPNSTKYRKYFKPRKKNEKTPGPQVAKKLNYLALVSMEPGFLNGAQIEAARRNIRRKVKKEGAVQIFILPDLPVTKKPTAARMGKGKGKVTQWIANLSVGQTLFRLHGLEINQAVSALRAGAKKLPLKFRIKKL